MKYPNNPMHLKIQMKWSLKDWPFAKHYVDSALKTAYTSYESQRLSSGEKRVNLSELHRIVETYDRIPEQAQNVWWLKEVQPKIIPAQLRVKSFISHRIKNRARESRCHFIHLSKMRWNPEMSQWSMITVALPLTGIYSHMNLEES